jgi:outer membrane lipoprotein-sorting protein
MRGLKKPVAWLSVMFVLAVINPRDGAAQSAAASAQDGDLQKVLAQLNAASAKFKNAQADFSWDTFQAVVQVHDTQTGVISFEHSGGTTRMAAYFNPEAGQSAGKIVVYDGSRLEYYEPTIKQMNIYRAGPNSGQYESFLTLGFGGSGTDLEKNWDLTLLGREKIGGTDTVKLDLKSKDPKIQNNFTHITIWVDPTRSVSLKQVFYEPSGDQRPCVYANIKYNLRLNGDVFRIQTAPGTAVQVH